MIENIDINVINDYLVIFNTFVGCVVSVVTLVFSIKTYKEINKNDKSNSEDKMIEMLMNAEEKVYESKGEKVWKERYINILDLICYKYLSNKIDKTMFENCLVGLVKWAYNDSEYKMLIDEKANNVLKVYKNLKL